MRVGSSASTFAAVFAGAHSHNRKLCYGYSHNFWLGCACVILLSVTHARGQGPVEEAAGAAGASRPEGEVRNAAGPVTNDATKTGLESSQSRRALALCGLDPAGPARHIGALASGFAASSTYDQLVMFCAAMKETHPNVIISSMGMSHNGKSIPLLIISDPPLDEGSDYASQVRARAGGGSLVIFAIGNIHAGEVDGKEALMLLAAQMANAKPALLSRTVLLIAPMYNVDGNEPFVLTSRPGQIGPALGQGKRENAQGLDLNRDFIKLDAEETRGLVRVLNEYDPHIFIDTHTTDGSYHRYVMTYDGNKVPAGSRELINYSRDTFLPAVRSAFISEPMKTYVTLDRAVPVPDVDAFVYGNFDAQWNLAEVADGPRPHSRWETFPAEGRYATNYVGLRNRLSVLTESYSYAPYATRIGAQLGFLHSILSVADARSPQIRALLTLADESTVGLAEGASTEPAVVAVRTRAQAFKEPITVKGYVETITKGRSIPTGEHAEYTVEHFGDFVATQTVPRPLGYVLLPGTPQSVIERVRLHGARIEEITAPRAMRVEDYTIVSAKPASRIFQNRVLVNIEATIGAAQDREIPAGSSIISTAQPLGNLIVYLLEPACEDGLAAWGFFDAHLKGEYPVLRIVK
jgi:dipeptidyl-peptidase-4